jgi:hypothetical protein
VPTKLVCVGVTSGGVVGASSPFLSQDVIDNNKIAKRLKAFVSYCRV